MPDTAPWVNPPQRDKKLRTRKAERAARRAEFWGRRREEAQAEGPEAVAEFEWDRARASLERLAEPARSTAFEALARAVETVREKHGQ